MSNPSSSRSSSGIAWPGLVVLLGSICAYWLAQNELNTSRPEAPRNHSVPDPVGSEALGAAYSRMWDDPISTTFEHYENHKPKSATETFIETVLDPSVPEETEISEASPEQKIKTLFANLIHQYEGESTLCLPILVNGGPHAEDQETRLRTRYAVVTALAHAGYKLSFPDRMSYAVVKANVLAMKEGPEWKEETFVIPVKLYRPMDDPYAEGHGNHASGDKDEDRGKQESATTKGKQILVLWINESQLGKTPLLALNRIAEGMFGDVEPRERGETSNQTEEESIPILSFRIIGPTSSDTLNEIQSELEALYYHGEDEKKQKKAKAAKSEWVKNGVNPLMINRELIPIFSARATVSEMLTSHWNEKIHSQLESLPHFDIIRTIGNDHFLVSHAIHQELAARGAWPDASRNQMMILLTEHDTSYGRRIVNELEHVFRVSSQQKGSSQNNTESGEDESQKTGAGNATKVPVRVFKYLRGIDGQTSAESARDSEPKKTSSNSGDELYGFPTSGISTRPPHGKSQYDYLRRLKQEIQQIKDSKRVTAIGVVGSDVYDKLLILRALRPHFPDTVFFTTDLDAIYIHPEELHHTRNLIIASHFGLTINSPFHDLINFKSSSELGMLPFRDSYQTSEHLATRIAIGDEGIRGALKTLMPQDKQSEDELKMAAYLWDHSDHSVEKDDEILLHTDGVLRPVLTTVGNNGFRQLRIPPLSSKPPDTEEREQKPDFAGLQPIAGSRVQPMRASGILLLIVLGSGGLFLWEDRERVKQFLKPGLGMLPSDNNAENQSQSSERKEFLSLEQNDAEEVRLWLLCFFWVTVALGGLLLACLFFEAVFGWEKFVLDGTSVLPRIIVNILIGLITAGTLVHFTHRIMQCRLGWKQRTNPSFEASKLIDQICGDDPYSPELRELCTQRVCKIASLWIVCSIWCAGVLAFSSIFEWITLGSLGVTAVLMAAHSRSKKSSPEGGDLWNRLDRTKKVLLIGSVAALGITMFGSYFPFIWRFYPFVYGGWGPEFISRGVSSRVLDRAAMLFGYFMLTGLFITVLYGQHWSREFTRHLRRLVNESRLTSQDSNVDGRVESLILIGESTAVTNIYTPWLLAYLLIMVLAYHPLTSPVPVPAGLLVLLSLAILLLVVSTLYLRFVVQSYREQVLYDLRGELFEVRRDQEYGSSSSKDAGPTQPNEASLPVAN